MADPLNPGKLFDALRAVAACMDEHGAPHALIGGVAASILARPRYTDDVDILISMAEIHWQPLLDCGTRFGIVPRIPNALAFARRSRVLLLRHEPSEVDVDVTIAQIPFEEAIIERATRQTVEGIAIRIVTPEDLVVMKIVAHRPQDLIDIENVLRARPKFDEQRVTRDINLLVAEAELPELAELWSSLKVKYRPAKRKRR